ncbi:MAG: hypothetical protein IPM81_14605 [Saprospirales bacterium]|nr:hypothetical protein [Saprospirales bacterium]
MKSLTLPAPEHRPFYVLLLLALAPVWLSGRFFVTGDGPCHVYNARLLLDFLLGRHQDFYAPFYQLNLHAEPNWLSHLSLAALQLVCSPELAEKIFLSAYVLLFGFGWRYLLGRINPGSLFLSTVGLLFVWHHLLLSGFYNFAMGVALFFWVSGYWLQYRGDWTTKRLLVLAAAWLLLYATHATGITFTLLFIGSAWLVGILQQARRSGWQAAWKQAWPGTWRTALTALPALLLLAVYFWRQPPHTGKGAVPEGMWQSLYQLKSLIVMNSFERDTVKAVAILVGLLLAGALWLRVRERRIVAADFILLFVAVALWQYFLPANALAPGLQIPLRIQSFVWLGVLCWIATANYPQWVKENVPVMAGALMIALLYLRLPAHRQASALAEDYVSCTEHLQDRSVVLFLNYDFSGLSPQNRAIANQNWIFIHAADYIGAYRPLILSDNYEATKTHFPINWHWQRNMYAQTEKDGIGFENRPPRADILGYKQRSGGYDIDYVLLLSYDARHYDHDYAREIMGQVNQGYEFVFRAPGGKAEVWRRKRALN